MSLKYHQATFDMLTQSPIDAEPWLHDLAEYEAALNHSMPPERRAWTSIPLYQHEPTVSDAAVKRLDEFEIKYEVRLPESFREWYSLDIGLPMLYVDGSWWPVSIEESYAPWHEAGIQLLDEGLLIFTGEQQFGEWCIRLDKGDNPPVCWLNPESDFDQTPPDIRLSEDAPSFSD